MFITYQMSPEQRIEMSSRSFSSENSEDVFPKFESVCDYMAFIMGSFDSNSNSLATTNLLTVENVSPFPHLQLHFYCSACAHLFLLRVAAKFEPRRRPVINCKNLSAIFAHCLPSLPSPLFGATDASRVPVNSQLQLSN